MKITISVANLLATKFYYTGIANSHPGFPPFSVSQRKLTQKSVKRNFILPFKYDYKRFSKLKLNLIDKGASYSPLYNSRTLKVEISNSHKQQAKRLRVQLINLLNKYQSGIDKFLANQNINVNKKFKIIILPLPIEFGETLGDVLLLSSKMPATVALAIALEEMLHAIIKLPSKKLFGLSALEDDLFSESYIGAVLYKLLIYIKFPSNVVQSVVFGWQGGRRKKAVQLIIKHGS